MALPTTGHRESLCIEEHHGAADATAATGEGDLVFGVAFGITKIRFGVRAESLIVTGRFTLKPLPLTAVMFMACLIAALPLASANCHATLPPAPTIINVTSEEEGSLTVDFEDEHAYQLAMELDGNDIEKWNYDSSLWTSTELLDDGANKKTVYFNKKYNKVRVDILLETGEHNSMEWTHNLDMSLQEIFTSGAFHPATDDRFNEWSGLLGKPRSSQYAADGTTCYHEYRRGFNMEILTQPDPGAEIGVALPAAVQANSEPVVQLKTRLGLWMSMLNPSGSYTLLPGGQITGIIGIGFNTGRATADGLPKSAGGECSRNCVHSPCPSDFLGSDSGPFKMGSVPAKVKVYVGSQDAGCRNYTITTSTSPNSVSTTSSPAIIRDLEVTGPPLLVSAKASSAQGFGPAAVSTTPVRPCRCSCEQFAAPALRSVSTTKGDGVLRVNFSQPSNVPAACAQPGMINYTITTNPPPPSRALPEGAKTCTVCNEDRVLVPIKHVDCPVTCGATNGRVLEGWYTKSLPNCDSCSLTCGDLCKGGVDSCGTEYFLNNCAGNINLYRIACAKQEWKPPFATLEGLDPTISYTVEITASNNFGSSPVSSASSSVTPCFCSCEIPNAPVLMSATSHLLGTLTVKFDGPTNVPTSCLDDQGIIYTIASTSGMRLQSDGHHGLEYTVSAVPKPRFASAGAKAVSGSFPTTIATLTGLDPSTEYDVIVHASNALGIGPNSVTMTSVTAVPTTASQSWSSIRGFMHGLTAHSPTNATFTLQSPQQDPTAGYTGKILIRGQSQLTIYGEGAIMNANYTGQFFDLAQEKGATLKVYNLTMRNAISGPPNARCNGGAVMAAFSALVGFYSCTFEGNTIPSKGAGGAIYLIGSTIELLDCKFIRNGLGGQAFINGGALKTHFLTRATVRDTDFIENVGKWGGAIWFDININNVSDINDFVRACLTLFFLDHQRLSVFEERRKLTCRNFNVGR
jgi:hypothetical protein